MPWDYPWKKRYRATITLPRHYKNSYRKGLRAEFIAAMLLRLKGYRIVETRYRSHYGEIDIIARRGKRISFVEVKARSTLDEALWAITPRQQKRIARTAIQWMARYPQFSGFDISLDVILIAPKHFPCHMKNAFSISHKNF